MADIDIETTISDVKLFLEKLKGELPEVFKPTPATDGAEAEQPHEETVEFHCDKVLIGKRTQNIGMPSSNG